jgi:hypothetical protein
MQPRHLGVSAVLVKSFARIHETNLKKQGMLALTFSNEADYDKIQEDDRIDFTDLTSFAPGKPLTVVLNHKDGSEGHILHLQPHLQCPADRMVQGRWRAEHHPGTAERVINDEELIIDYITEPK